MKCVIVCFGIEKKIKILQFSCMLSKIVLILIFIPENKSIKKRNDKNICRTANNKKKLITLKDIKKMSKNIYNEVVALM